MHLNEFIHVAVLCSVGVLLFVVVEILVAAVCRRNAALARWYYFLALLPLIWLAVAVGKATYSETFNWVPDSIGHDLAARQIADLLATGKYALAAQDLRANNYGFRFILGLGYAIAGSPPPVAAYVVNSLVALSGLILLLDLICRSFRADSIPAYVVVIIGLLPTALFWATAINKEALMLFGIILMLRLVLYFDPDREFRGGVIGPIVGLLICGFLRPHVAMCWFSGMVLGIIVTKRNYTVALIGCLAFPLLFLAFRSFTTDIIERFESEGITETMANYQKGAWGGGSQIERTKQPVPIIDGIAMLFLRPYPQEIHNSSALLTSVEIWIITASLLVGWLMTYKRRDLARSSLMVCAFTSLISLSFFFSYMQNLGYMSRQRLQALPAILILALGPFVSIPSATTRKNTVEHTEI